MGQVKDAKFFGQLTRALGATPYQRLTSGTTSTRSLILKALDDEMLKAVYVTTVSIPSNGVTSRELTKNWIEEGQTLTEQALKTLAKQFLLVSGGTESPVFKIDANTIESSLEVIGYHVYSPNNSGLFRFECLVRVTKPGS